MRAPSTDRRPQPPGPFERFASSTAGWSGHAVAFSASTFLMVFVIQNTINRDSLAIHAKLDELIRASEEASNTLMHAEQLSEASIESILRRERDRIDE
jgi:low affinity Fe/Cu permease